MHRLEFFKNQPFHGFGKDSTEQIMPGIYKQQVTF